jgi:hypothetical protein
LDTAPDFHEYTKEETYDALLFPQSLQRDTSTQALMDHLVIKSALYETDPRNRIDMNCFLEPPHCHHAHGVSKLAMSHIMILHFFLLHTYWSYMVKTSRLKMKVCNLKNAREAGTGGPTDQHHQHHPMCALAQ